MIRGQGAWHKQELPQHKKENLLSAGCALSEWTAENFSELIFSSIASKKLFNPFYVTQNMLKRISCNLK